LEFFNICKEVEEGAREKTDQAALSELSVAPSVTKVTPRVFFVSIVCARDESGGYLPPLSTRALRLLNNLQIIGDREKTANLISSNAG
jgi:hypothetical protein